MTHFYKLAALFLLLVTAPTFAEQQSAFDLDLLNIQQQWAKVNYTLHDDQQEEQFKLLLESAKAFSSTYPQRAESWIWYGIIQSSYAGAKGGLGALSFAKEAKISLQKALEIDETALAGSAYTSLGTLYHQVPGWPIGFGNDKYARKMLSQALTINPKGVDPNYFYGAFLYDEGDYQEAKAVLLQAQQAPRRKNRPLADKERQKEVSALLAKVVKKLQ